MDVAIGLLRDRQGRLLISYRRAGQTYGEHWEFPGGKLEAGEDGATALRRELAEELGIIVTQAQLWRVLSFAYPERRVRLQIWEVQTYTGTPWGREQQPLAWVSLAELPRYHLLPANRHIVNALQLPLTYLITPEPQDDFCPQLEQALAAGVRLVRLRTRLTGAALARVTERTLSCCQRAGAQLLLSGATSAQALGADGVHLTARELMALQERPQAQQWVAASCHTQTELAHALAIGVDFAVLSPVQTTPSHPDTQPLGWPQFSRWVAAQPLPVYALGGLTRTDLPQALAAGAQGIAAIRGLWGPG